MQIQLAALEQRGHLIPRLIHLAPVDALDRNAFKNNIFGKSDLTEAVIYL